MYNQLMAGEGTPDILSLLTLSFQCSYVKTNTDGFEATLLVWLEFGDLTHTSFPIKAWACIFYIILNYREIPL